MGEKRWEKLQIDAVWVWDVTRPTIKNDYCKIVFRANANLVRDEGCETNRIMTEYLTYWIAKK